MGAYFSRNGKDVSKKDDEKALENLKQELKAKHRKVSIALCLNQDDMKKEKYEKVLESLKRKPKVKRRKVSIALDLNQDVTNREEDKEILENHTAPIILDFKQDTNNQMLQFRTAPQSHPLLITVGPYKDVKKKKDKYKKALEKQSEELKYKHVKAYIMSLTLLDKIFEWDKISFERAMEKAWFTNSIIMERCLISNNSGANHKKEIEKVIDYNNKLKQVIDAGLDCVLFGTTNKRKHSSYENSDQEIEKVMDFNKKLKQVIDAGLNVILFGTTKKRKRSSYENSDQELEELKYLKGIKEILPSSEDTEKIERKKFESREECLQSVINSLLERESEEREREATENEILGYMLLQEIAKCALKFPSMELPNSITPSSVDGDQQDEKIVIQINKLYTEHANTKSNYQESWALNYYAFLMKAKSVCNNSISEEQVNQMLVMLEEVTRETGECLVRYRKYQSKWAAERRFETKLFEHCENLSYFMRLDRRLNPVSESEVNKLEKIMCLVSDAIDKYRRESGPESFPTITQPYLPTWRQLI